MRIHQYYVYILTNLRNTVLYAGVINNLVRICYEHRKGLVVKGQRDPSLRYRSVQGDSGIS